MCFVPEEFKNIKNHKVFKVRNGKMVSVTWEWIPSLNAWKDGFSFFSTNIANIGSWFYLEPIINEKNNGKKIKKKNFNKGKISY
jgi:hypothetical protein